MEIRGVIVVGVMTFFWFFLHFVMLVIAVEGSLNLFDIFYSMVF